MKKWMLNHWWQFKDTSLILKFLIALCVDGGLEEMQDDLSSGKIMYAYVKIIDPNTNLPKFVFINWVRVLNNFISPYMADKKRKSK